MRTRIAATTAAAGGVLMVLATGVAPASAGVTGPAFYVDGSMYRTVLTPTDLTGTGGPDKSFDTLYSFGGPPAGGGDRGTGGSRLQRWALAGPRAGLPGGL